MNNGKRPNIVIIITDSQGWNALGECGDGFVETPNIDRLAQEGMKFTRAYNTCPLCTPARAGLFTGQYPHNAGAWSNDLPLGKTVNTIGQYFQNGGYRTAYIGKWHLDGTDYFGTGIPAEGYEPDYWYDGRNYLYELTKDKRLLWRSGLNTPEKILENNITRGFTWAAGITDRAKQFIADNNEDQPYLMVVSYDEPHGPSTCPPPYCNMYLDRPYPLPENFQDNLHDKPEHHQEWAKHFNMDPEKEYISQPLYFGCVSFVDSEIGKVIDAANEFDRDNTIIIFTTDHGHYLGAHKLRSKGPALYEEVVKVPLIFRGIDVINSGAECDNLTSHLDVIPTLLEMADIDIAPILKGKSMTGSLLNPENAGSHRDEVLIEYHRHGVSHDSWFGFTPIRSLVTERYKLTINLHQSDELYDLGKDPGEMNNLIDNNKYQSIRDDLHDHLIEVMNKSRDPFRGPIWEMRPWRNKRDSIWIDGKRRMRPDDGFLPKAYNYNTGLNEDGEI